MSLKSILLILVLVFIISACATVVAPNGGLKDTSPPIPISYNPPNGSMNMLDKEVVIKFDEYIVLQELLQQMVVSPQMPETPDVSVRGKKLIIKIPDSLRENTTYTIFFGDAVVNYKENLPVHNFEYHFSTGNVVDSLQLHGNREGANLSNQNFEVTGKRVWWEVEDINKRYLEYNRKEENLPVGTVLTDEKGAAVFHFIPKDVGSHTFVMTGKDNAGNVIKKEFSIWVTDELASNSKFMPTGSDGLTFVLDKEKYEPQDIVQVSIASKVSDRDVLLGVERDFVHRFQVVHVDGNSTTVDINIEDADIPNMYISGASFDSDQLDTVGTEVKISSQSKKLDIDVVTDKDAYAPGDTVTVDIMTRDAQGNPREADVALWAVDKALFELVPQNNHDIYGAYWDHRPGDTSTTNSLRGIWIQMAEGGGCFLPGTQVSMDGGYTKNIEDVQVGDEILTFNDEQDNLVSARVL